jgi:hypothetical protein
MEPPKDCQVYETELARYWIDKDGIFYSDLKHTRRTIENTKSNLKFIKELAKGKKISIIVDITRSVALTKDVREILDKELMNIYTAIAFVARTPLANMNANVFLRLPWPPVKIFPSEKAAKKWLLEVSK